MRRFGVELAIPIAPGARAIAFSMGGGLLVGYAERLVRLGDHPLEFPLPAGFDLRAIAVDPGGYWLGGASELIGLRPARHDLAPRAECSVKSPVRALAYGPDRSIYALLEDHGLLRDGELLAVVEACGLARSGGRLLALTSDAIADITHFVATPPAKSPQIQLPGCDS